ncbi:trypsin-like serine protease with C-terminal PDZ domain [Arthrobacter crystallopoietes BAB-32]|uniref:Trypsin-like serine protease with C-terminal PDZ domain n=1 Tax=Arthrobacter crystallopoietes BAB-32 TaxID=1246476 RepID=N1V0B4_9MICC|nr:trypsin-like peptidase domain-containing protein [Arthrobacter crystallopoietes]EMY33522.1 trypsin-like serine protease with C-terminal PDZ domain [Arthrobacter crystallopoietes BAB-32]
MTEQNHDGGGRYQPGVPPQPQNPPSSGQAPAADQAASGRQASGDTQSIPTSSEPTQPLAGWHRPDGSAQGSSPYGQPAYGPGNHYNQPHQGSPSGYGPYSGHTYGQPKAFGSAPAQPAAGKPTAKKRFGSGTLVAGMLLAGLAGGGVAVGAQSLTGGPATSVSGASAQQLIVNNTDSVNEITAAAAKASPSVVTISVASGNAGGSGSGIILDGEGHILTNTHVVTLGGETSNPSVEVRTSDGRVHQAEVVGTDPLSDLAVIKIEADGLTPASFADTDKLNVGDTAIAIGAPLGLSGTVTDGIISTLSRTISVSSSAAPEEEESPAPGDQWNFQFPDENSGGNSSGQGRIHLNVIQTDAAINHGNSGGALVDTNGDVIGVNVAIASASQDSGSIGVGFAIPGNYAQRIADELIANGEATHGYLGVSVTAKASGNSSGGTQFSVGAEVAEVVNGSPADDAGLRKGDVITAVEDRVIGDSVSLTAAIREHPVGSKVSLTLLRGGQEQTVDVTIGDNPDN